nr:tetratricopeptide repeat protein [uncultured Flavobacterium sp.]
MFRIILLFITTLLSVQCQSQTETEEEKKVRQEQIIQEYVYDCADKINYFLMMKEYQACLDAGIKKDSTIAYLWQQKAMPYFKVKKYEVGMEYIDKAVKCDAKRYLPYRAFIKCVFAKTYKAAIKDFEECIANWGDSYEMDHTYSFYIGLSYLQLNEFKKAENYFKQTIEKQKAMFKEAHHLDLFYYAITKYEQENYDDAVKIFDEVLNQYPEFSDAIYYKALCFYKLNKRVDEYQNLISQAEEFAKRGYTINEDNAVYEQYPYQVKWKK